MAIWGKETLPKHLQNRLHDDWPWPFKYIPRAWTSFNIGYPVLLNGNGLRFPSDFDEIVWIGSIPTIYLGIWPNGFGKSFHPKPITSPGSWQLSVYPKAPWYLSPIAWYFAISFQKKADGKFHQIRFGMRWDNVDNYSNWPTFPTNRRYTGDDSQDTSAQKEM